LRASADSLSFCFFGVRNQNRLRGGTLSRTGFADFLRTYLPQCPTHERERFIFAALDAVLRSEPPYKKAPKRLARTRLDLLIIAHGAPPEPLSSSGTSYAGIVHEVLARIPGELRELALVRMLVRQYCDDAGAGARLRALDWLRAVAGETLFELDIDADDARICEYSAYLADISKIMPNVEALRSFARSHGVTLDEKQSVARFFDPLFWRRAVRKTLRQRRELMHMRLLPQRLRWCSDWGTRESEGMNMRHARWLADHEAVDASGHAVSMPTPGDIAKRAHARMFRTASYIARRAADAGATQAVAVTITLPSRFHPSTTAGGSRVPNARWDGSTPRDGKLFFDRRWALFDNQCRRLGIVHDYIMTAEPHADETPHWHGVFWTNDAPELCRLLTHYFYHTAEPDDGTADVRVRTHILKDAGEALAYASKTLAYVAKHQSGRGDARFADEAARSQAWARAWGIRRLRKSGVGVTLYEYLRRLDADAMADANARAIVEAARRGDMYEALKHKRFEMRYVEAVNRYGEEARRADGVVDLETGEILYKPQYKIKKKMLCTPAPPCAKAQEAEKALRAMASLCFSLDDGVTRLHQEKKGKEKTGAVIHDDAPDLIHDPP
jgi:hypothetical protein